MVKYDRHARGEQKMKEDDFDNVWQGRVDAEDGDEGLRLHQAVARYSPKANQGIVFAGLASDLGVDRNHGRVGAEHGPRALRSALANLAWQFDVPVYDAGDTLIDDQDGDPLARAQASYASTISQILSKHNFAIGFGGGHEISWGSYQGCRHFLDQLGHSSATLGILNFDAHFDLRKPKSNVSWVGSSGTPFYQVAQDCKQRGNKFQYACLGISQSSNTEALFQFAEDHSVHYLLDEDCGDDASGTLINEFISGIDALYVTICLDALPASVAPGVSAPAALGISLGFIIEALEVVREACDRYNVHWLMADIAELNPEFDRDHQTARVAARLVYELVRQQQAR